MTHNKSFQRKIIYGVCMIALLIAISMISRPATPPTSQGGQGDPGGLLAQKRTEYRIAQTEIGQLDPASESMRLSMMGLDGIATVVMWMQLNEYQKHEKYSHVEALCERITQVNPHFLSVWEFQAWNLSYNVSREFDNYKHRYLWVKKGASYQMKGTKHNYNQPKLMAKISEFFGLKIGLADEKVQFRELFPLDTYFHDEIDEYFVDTGLTGESYNISDDASGVESKPDNWLVARVWSLWAEQVVDLELGTIGNASPAIFHSTSTKRLMSFSDNIEKEGHIGELARRSWSKSNQNWQDFGQKDLTSSWGISFKLNDYHSLQKQAEDQLVEFDKLTNNLRDTIKQEKIAELPAESQAALNTPEEERTEEQRGLYYEADRKIQVPLSEVVKRIKDKQTQTEASRIAREYDDYNFRMNVINTQRGVVHYQYWADRSESEGTEEAIQARKLVYEAHQAFINANLIKARKLYEESWGIWKGIYDRYPILLSDAVSADLADYIKEYRDLLNQLDEDISPDFPLISLLEIHDDRYVPPKSSNTEEQPSDEDSEEKTEDSETEEKEEDKPAEENAKAE